MSFNEQEAIDHFINKQCGILHLNWFLDRYWTKVTREVFIPGLVSIYNKLVEKNFSEDNKCSWGDADGNLYFIPSKDQKVIVFTTQSRDYLFILTRKIIRDYNADAQNGNHFSPEYQSHDLHIRRIWRTYKKGDLRKDDLKTINDMIDNAETLSEFADDFSEYPQRPSIEMYRKIKFDLNRYHESPRFYGDIRDSGFILSYNPPFGGQLLEGSKYGHLELEHLLSCNLACMAIEVGASINIEDATIKQK